MSLCCLFVFTRQTVAQEEREEEGEEEVEVEETKKKEEPEHETTPRPSSLIANVLSVDRQEKERERVTVQWSHLLSHVSMTASLPRGLAPYFVRR